MTKNPYEIRLDLLILAQEQAKQRHLAQWNEAAKRADIHESVEYLSEVDSYPTTDQIIAEADKMKRFVDGAPTSTYLSGDLLVEGNVTAYAKKPD